MRLLAYLVALLLGLAAGVAAIAVHRTLPGLVLGTGAALVALWALRQWLARAGAAFAAGWLAPLVIGLVGRGEGDYLVASDPRGYLLIGAGLTVLLAGIVSSVPAGGRHDSRSVGAPT